MAATNGAKTVLVTGRGGMLGRAVARQLHEAGIKLHGCDRVALPEGELLEGERFFECDLADAAAIEKAAAGCDAVVHLGGVSGPGFVFNPPVPAGTVARTNITGTMNVLEAAKANKVKRVVFASSVIVYWPVDRARKFDETLIEGSAPLDSTETYGASKIAGEQLLRSYSAMGVVDGVSLRIGWVYGPGRTTGCVVRLMIEGVPMDTPLAHCRDFVYVTDTAAAIVKAVTRAENFGGIATNVSGQHASQEAVEAAVGKATGKKYERAPKDGATPDPPLPAMSLALAKKELGYEPAVSLEDGVLRYAQSLDLAAGSPAKKQKTAS